MAEAAIVEQYGWRVWDAHLDSLLVAPLTPEERFEAELAVWGETSEAASGADAFMRMIGGT